MRLILFALGLMAFSASAHTHQQALHLRYKNGDLHAHLRFTQGPSIGPENRLRMEFRRGQDHSPVDPQAQIEVHLSMPDMQMDAPPTSVQPIDKERGAVGVFEVSQMTFEMGGWWEMAVQLTFADGTQETQSIRIELAEGKGHTSHY